MIKSFKDFIDEGYKVANALGKAGKPVMKSTLKDMDKYRKLTDEEKLEKAYKDGQSDKEHGEYVPDEWGYTGSLKNAYDKGYGKK